MRRGACGGYADGMQPLRGCSRRGAWMAATAPLPKARDADCASEVLWLVGLPAGEEGVGGCDLCVGGLRRPRYDLLPPHLQLCCRLTQLQLQRALLPDRLLLEGGVAALEAVDRGEPPYEWTARG